jgi:PAS domain S-box-containing protein
MSFFAGNKTNRTRQSTVDALIRSYAQSFDASTQPVTITDPNGNVRYVNPAFTALTGYTAAEILGKTPRILKSGKHDGFFYHNMWLHLTGGRVWQGEITNRKKDGTLYVDEQTITPVTRDDDGQIGCFISVRHDATVERKQELEQIIREEETTLPHHIDALGKSARSPVELLEKSIALFLTLHEFRSTSSGLAFEVLQDEGVLRLAATHGYFHPDFLADEATVPLGECLCGKSAAEGRVLICQSFYKDARHERKWLGMRVRGHYTIPIRTQGRVLGVINLYTDDNVDHSERRVAFLAAAGFRLGAYLDKLCRDVAR